MAIRNFRWEDIPAIADLESRLLQNEGNTASASQQSVQEHLGQPNLHVEEDLFLYEVNGSLGGLAMVCLEPPIKRSVLILRIHPDHEAQGIEQALVQVALKRARELKASVLHVQVPQGSPWSKLLEEEGFNAVRVYWVMHWDVQGLPPIEVPEGFSFRTYGRAGDAETLTRIQNAAFGVSWGFSPNTPEEIAYRADMSMISHQGIIFLSEGEAVSGYCWTLVLDRGKWKVGVISMIGIDPAYRQRRLGKPLLKAGLEYLSSQGVGHVELEVDGENKPATRLYLSMGFKKVAERHWFEASLEAPSSPDTPSL
ncbi:MAG: GNAT family N-acetyltransferase [Dehalococcoidia bacterium]